MCAVIWRVSLLLLALALPGTAAKAAECEFMRFGSGRFTVCSVDVTQNEVRLFLRDGAGAPYGDFSALPEGVRIAMNGGMYHEDRRPVGHYIEDGAQQMRVIENAGPGNFGLLPNGVLCLRAGRADVIETLRYVAEAPACTHATQSGPMLVIDGALHPRFLPDSNSFKRRNGVGTSADGKTLYLAISANAVTFDTFGRLFRDALGVPNALFLDGSISRLYDAETGRNDGGARMGPILAVMDNAPTPQTGTQPASDATGTTGADTN